MVEDTMDGNNMFLQPSEKEWPVPTYMQLQTIRKIESDTV